jgi:serine/threonine protein kinase
VQSITPTTGTPSSGVGGADAPTEEFQGRCVGNSYILIRPIGHGATGTVWRAVDRTTGAQVAVKLLREDLVRHPKLVTRFVQERAILLMLRHPHIVRVRDLLTVGDSLGLVMDLVEGGSLREYLHARGTLPVAQAARLLAQVAAALAEAHRLGVVHRDLKPDNVLVDLGPDGPETRLTDFGIARVLDSPGMTTPGALLGTPNYLAPEAIHGGRPTPASDVYALGILLYELIVGFAPYAGGPAAGILRRHLDEAPTRYPGIPDLAWSVLESCLRKELGERPSAANLATTLESLARATVDVPALVRREPTPRVPDLADEGDDLDLGIPLPRRPRNRVARRRWLRSGALVAVVAGTFAALAVPGLTPWHLLDSGRPRRPAASAPAPVHSAPRAAAQPTHPGPSSAPAPGQTPVAGAGLAVSAGPNAVSAGIQVYGPWTCSADYEYDTGHPVLARPCYAIGGTGIRVLGHLQALPGVQADVSLSVQSVDTGTTVAGPDVCAGIMFTDFAPQHDCGPFDLTGVAHGQRLVVILSWSYTGRAILPSGTARGPEFTW